MRLSEDRDFTIRLASKFKVLCVPISMGCHLTRSYFSADRLKQFYKESNYRWVGVLLRKHFFGLKGGALRTFVGILEAEKGIFLGLVLQASVLAGLISGQTFVTTVFLLVVLADLGRFVWQRRLREYVPMRIVGPWMVLGGLVARQGARPVYEVRRLA